MPVVYHSRNPQPGVSYKYYPKLLDMARDVDTLMVIVPGGAATANMINAEVLKALGPQGILINMARGSVVDEPALIEALKNRTIYSAGLDVFAKEPDVPKELIEMDHIVLFPHLGSSTEVDARGDGPARGRQHPGLGRRQAAAHAGRRNALSAQALNHDIAAALVAACWR